MATKAAPLKKANANYTLRTALYLVAHSPIVYIRTNGMRKIRFAFMAAFAYTWLTINQPLLPSFLIAS